jgi:hypothetical protein
MQRDTEGSPDACADRDRWAKFILSISHNSGIVYSESESYLADCCFFLASARRSVFLRRAARFLTLSLPLGFPIRLQSASPGRRQQWQGRSDLRQLFYCQVFLAIDRDSAIGVICPSNPAAAAATHCRFSIIIAVIVLRPPGRVRRRALTQSTCRKSWLLWSC